MQDQQNQKPKKPTTKKASEPKSKPAKEQKLDPNVPLDLAKLICKQLNEKKGKDIIYINIEQKTIIADYFVIASGGSSTAVNALAAQVEEKLSKDYGIEPIRKEGVRDGRWAAIDYGSVIVHIFYEETRQFYGLERLWADSENLTNFEE